MLRPAPRENLPVPTVFDHTPGRWGGAVRTFLLAEALQKLEHEVEIVGFLFGEAPRDLAAAKIPIITVAGKNYLCSQTETDHLGNSSVKKTTDSQVRDKQLSNVKFLGYIQHSQLASLLQAADVLAHPSPLKFFTWLREPRSRPQRFPP